MHPGPIFIDLCVIIENMEKNDDRLLLRKTEERRARRDSSNILTNTMFLDPHEQSVILSAFRDVLPESPADLLDCAFLYGGYPGAERRIAVFTPGYETHHAELLSVIRAEHSERSSAAKSGRPLSHGDYLGALMGLGVKREVLGDILVRPDGADIIVMSEMAEHLAGELTQAGRSNLSTSVLPIGALIVPAREKKIIRDTVASLRLDNIVSSAFGISRSKAAEAITCGLVFVNHIEQLKTDKQISEGDLITLRHKGRARLGEVGGTSKKGRISILIER